MQGDSFDVAPGLPSYIPPLSLMRDPCCRHGESQTFCSDRLYGHVACEPGADAQVVFQVKTQKRFFPVYTNTPMLNQLACSWNSIYFCQRGDLDIMRAMQEILLAAIYHRVERQHICVYLKESADKISIWDLDEKRSSLDYGRTRFLASVLLLWEVICLFSCRFPSERRRRHFPSENEAESAGEIIAHFGLSTPKSLISCGTTSESTINPSSTAFTQATGALSRGRWI